MYSMVSSKVNDFTKASFEEWLSKLLKKTQCGTVLSAYYANILFELLKNSTSYPNIKPPHHYFKVDNYTIAGGRRVKMIFACAGNATMPLPKSKLINAIWPPKSKKKPNQAQTHLAQFKGAARYIITQQISEYRDSIELPIKCPLSLKNLRTWKEIHVDHKYPFINLLEEWLEFYDLNPQEIKLVGPPSAKTFADESLSRSWYDWHKEKAVLQAVHSKANLKKGRKLDYNG